MAKGYIFVDEAGDPGAPFTVDATGAQIATGASPFYIISATCIDEKRLFLLEQRMMEEKTKSGYLTEIKSNEISLRLYEALLAIVNELEVKTYFRLVDKNKYQGQFKVDGIPTLHNVFDEYNVARAVAFGVMECGMEGVEIIIDRTDRRLLDGKFDAFNDYLKNKVKKYIGESEANRISHVTHVDSKYVNAMQMSDIIGGAIRDNFTGKNIGLIKVIKHEHLVEADGRYENKLKKKPRKD